MICGEPQNLGLSHAKIESERLALKPDSIKSDAKWKAFVKLKTSKEHRVQKSMCLT